MRNELYYLNSFCFTPLFVFSVHNSRVYYNTGVDYYLLPNTRRPTPYTEHLHIHLRERVVSWYV